MRLIDADAITEDERQEHGFFYNSDLQELLDEQPTIDISNTSNTLNSLDCVERQAAMKIRFSSGFDHDGILFVPYRDVEEHLKKLPSVQPLKGKWLKAGTRMGIPLFECSLCECGDEVPTVMGKPSYNFCPYCGADMREGDADEVN